MKKHFYKLIIIILLILAVGAGILEGVINPKEESDNPNKKIGVQTETPKDYIISNSIDVLVNEDNYVHTDHTIVKGILSDIVYSQDSISWLIVTTEDKSQYKIACSNMELISTDVIKTEQADGLDAIHLYFRTGGDISLVEGQDVKLYKTSSGGFSFDERMHDKAKDTDFTGTITDFVFLPITEQNSDIYISHMVVQDSEGRQSEVYFYNLETQSIKSQGDLRVHYMGNVSGDYVFDVEENNEFAIVMETQDKTYEFKIGQEINLKNNESKGYWEIKDQVDTSIHKAEVTGFEFGFTGDNITSLDYINISIDNNNISLTMLQTNAEYAIPHGSYKKVYKYDVHDKVLSKIEPLEEFLIELYYENDILLEVMIGSQIWVHQNSEGIWTVAYEYQPEE